MSGPIRYIEVTGDELRRICTIIGKAVAGEDIDTVTIGCLAIAVTAKNPNMDPDALVEGIKGASEWISTYLSSLDDKIGEKEPN